MLNIKATYQRQKYNYKTDKMEPSGEPETVAIVETILPDDAEVCFLAVKEDGSFFYSSIGHFTLVGEGWLHNLS